MELIGYLVPISKASAEQRKRKQAQRKHHNVQAKIQNRSPFGGGAASTNVRSPFTAPSGGSLVPHAGGNFGHRPGGGGAVGAGGPGTVALRSSSGVAVPRPPSAPGGAAASVAGRGRGRFALPAILAGTAAGGGAYAYKRRRAENGLAVDAR